MRRILQAVIACASLAVFTACPNPTVETPKAQPPKVDIPSEPVELSGDKAITAFSFTNPPAVGVINETDHSIAVRVPIGTDLSSLAPTVVHTGVSISPASGVSQNFTVPVTYTVTAEDESTREYTVTVAEEASGDKAITAFSFTNPPAAGVINDTDHTIAVTVPYNTNKSNLSPTITYVGASISPASGAAQNFNIPVIYTVTADNGSTREYTVTVTEEASGEKAITAFSFENPAAVGVINETDHTIAVTVPFGTNRASLTPTVVHTGVWVSPASGVAQNFFGPLNYTVVAQDGTLQAYVVTVTIAANTAKSITAFSFENPPAVGVINETDHTIAVTVPYGTNRASLTPTITHTGASVSPASQAAQNFSAPVTYTVTAVDGSVQEYAVTVTTLPPGVFSVRFHKNAPDATGEMSPQSMTQDTSVPLALNEFARAGYAFKGWAVSAAGSVVYLDGDSFTMGGADANLFAVWIPVKAITVTVTLTPGGEFSVTGNATIERGEDVILSIPANMTAQSIWLDTVLLDASALASLRFSTTGRWLGKHRVTIAAVDNGTGEVYSGSFDVYIYQ